MQTGKIVIAAAAMVVSCAMCTDTWATQYSASGTVAVLRSHDVALSSDWFELTGVTSLGTCPTYNGLVLVALKDDDRALRHFAMVLSAKRAATALTVWVDDSVVNSNGFCYVRYMQ